jgi:hypothetical protein
VEAVFGADLGRFRDAVDRYCRAVDLEVRVRREWEALGRPLLVKHGAVGVHSLVKLLVSTARRRRIMARGLGWTR